MLNVPTSAGSGWPDPTSTSAVPNLQGSPFAMSEQTDFRSASIHPPEHVEALDSHGAMLPPRLRHTLQNLGIEMRGSGIAYEYAAEFRKIISLLVMAVETYPFGSGFCELNQALRELPSYESFLISRVTDSSLPVSPEQMRFCLKDLTANADPRDLRILEMQVRRLRKIKIADPHMTQAKSNLAALTKFCRYCNRSLGIIKGRGPWSIEGGNSLMHKLNNALAHDLKYLSAVYFGGG